jgi:hypothetical protein
MSAALMGLPPLPRDVSRSWLPFSRKIFGTRRAAMRSPTPCRSAASASLGNLLQGACRALRALTPVWAQHGGYLQDEGGADGGVERAHAVDDGVRGVQLREQARVGRREHLMLARGALRAEVEDAAHGRRQRRAPHVLVHAQRPRQLCTCTPAYHISLHASLALFPKTHLSLSPYHIWLHAPWLSHAKTSVSKAAMAPHLARRGG